MNDKWLRSTAYLTYQLAEEYSLGECIEKAQEGSNSQIYAAADAYLNNAGQGGGAGAADAGGNGNSGGSGSNSGDNTGGNNGGGGNSGDPDPDDPNSD